MRKVPAAELMNRLKKFTTLMDMTEESWRYVFIFNPITAYYFTGTMQDGVLFIMKGEEPEYFVRRSPERAEEETQFSKITPFKEFEEIYNKLHLNNYFPIYIDKKFTPIGHFESFNRMFEFTKIYSCDKVIDICKSIKSKYEIDIIKKAGSLHQNIMENIVPDIFHSEISEREAALTIFNEFVKAGHEVRNRFAYPGKEFDTVSVAFGDSSLKLYGTDFPIGTRGLSSCSRAFGSPDIKIRTNDLISVKSIFTYEGYHSVSTYCYSYNNLVDYIRKIQNHCANLSMITQEVLKPGIKPSDIYEYVLDRLHPEINGTFMGIGHDTLDYVGQGVGLTIDEYPVIRKNEEVPLQENMILSIGFFTTIEGFGVTGLENTFQVTPNGGVSLNGDASEVRVAGKYIQKKEDENL